MLIHMMTSAEKLLSVARAFADARNLSMARVSTLAANDGKLLPRVEAGRTITLQTYDNMLDWFAAHWPDGVMWPDCVDRPEVMEQA